MNVKQIVSLVIAGILIMVGAPFILWVLGLPEMSFDYEGVVPLWMYFTLCSAIVCCVWAFFLFILSSEF